MNVGRQDSTGSDGLVEDDVSESLEGLSPRDVENIVGGWLEEKDGEEVPETRRANGVPRYATLDTTVQELSDSKKWVMGLSAVQCKHYRDNPDPYHIIHTVQLTKDGLKIIGEYVLLPDDRVDLPSGKAFIAGDKHYTSVGDNIFERDIGKGKEVMGAVRVVFLRSGVACELEYTGHVRVDLYISALDAVITTLQSILENSKPRETVPLAAEAEVARNGRTFYSLQDFLNPFRQDSFYQAFIGKSRALELVGKNGTPGVRVSYENDKAIRFQVDGDSERIATHLDKICGERKIMPGVGVKWTKGLLDAGRSLAYEVLMGAQGNGYYLQITAPQLHSVDRVTKLITAVYEHVFAPVYIAKNVAVGASTVASAGK